VAGRRGRPCWAWASPPRSAAPPCSPPAAAGPTRVRVSPVRHLRRTLHPAAWWLWALGLATAASRTTNPVLLALLAAAACFVVVRRRGDAPWALAFRLYVVLAGIVVASRVLFRVVFGGGGGEVVLVTLPELPLPAVAAGIRLFGPVTAEELLSGLYDGLRLATMLLCLGAANALANPKRLLKAVPAALYEAGTAVVVALSVAPQLAESVLRVRRARRLRGGDGRGIRALRAILLPVLADALDRSLALAAAMDSRGYARTGTASQTRPPAGRPAPTDTRTGTAGTGPHPDGHRDPTPTSVPTDNRPSTTDSTTPSPTLTPGTDPRRDPTAGGVRQDHAADGGQHHHPAEDVLRGRQVGELRHGHPADDARHGHPTDNLRHGHPTDDLRHGHPADDLRHGHPARHGRPADDARHGRPAGGVLVVGGLLGVCVGAYGLLDATTPRVIGLPVLAAGLAVAAAGLAAGARAVVRTRYRADRWAAPEVAVAACGIGAGALLFVTASVDPAALYPSLSPLGWPTLTALPAAAAVLATLPAWLAPPAPVAAR